MGVASHHLTLFFSASIKATRMENNAEYSYSLGVRGMTRGLQVVACAGKLYAQMWHVTLLQLGNFTGFVCLDLGQCA